MCSYSYACINLYEISLIDSSWRHNCLHQFQEDLSVSGTGTVVIRTPKGSQPSSQFRDQNSLVIVCTIRKEYQVLKF